MAIPLQSVNPDLVTGFDVPPDGTSAPASASTKKNRYGQRSQPKWARHIQHRVLWADGVAVWLALFISSIVRLEVADLRNYSPAFLGIRYAIASAVLMVVWLAALSLFGSRDTSIMGTGSQEYSRVVKATVAVVSALAIGSYLTRWQIARSYVAVALPLGIVLLVCARWIARRRLVEERIAGKCLDSALLIGSTSSLEHLIDEMRFSQSAGLNPVAVCVPGFEGIVTDQVAGLPVIGDLDYLSSYVAANDIDTVVLTSSDHLTPAQIKDISWSLEETGTTLVMAPGLTDVAGTRIRTRPMSGTLLMQVDPPGYTSDQQKLKRAFDIVVSSALICIFAVPLAVTAIAIKLTSPGPVLFKPARVGIDGNPLTILKFRSMVSNAEQILPDADRLASEDEDSVGVFRKPKNDSRITPIGAFMRRFSIDELPQLFNVLFGSMSLVGPRPLLPADLDQYGSAADRRALVKPGMTGLWQVSGRSNLGLERSVRLDLYYVDNWSMVEDFLILARTAKAVFARDGAY